MAVLKWCNHNQWYADEAVSQCFIICTNCTGFENKTKTEKGVQSMTKAYSPCHGEKQKGKEES